MSPKSEELLLQLESMNLHNHTHKELVEKEDLIVKRLREYQYDLSKASSALERLEIEIANDIIKLQKVRERLSVL
jgi:hypothetical protein